MYFDELLLRRARTERALYSRRIVPQKMASFRSHIQYLRINEEDQTNKLHIVREYTMQVADDDKINKNN